MLRVLTLSTLFPNAASPRLGPFVEQQAIAFAARPEVESKIVAPIGRPIWPLSAHPHYRRLEPVPERETWRGLDVLRPRFPVWPKLGEARAGRDLAAALLPRLREFRHEFPFDVIDAQYFWPDGVAALHLSRALGVPFSIKARGSDISYWPQRPGVGAQLKAAAREADGLLAVSAGLREEMAAVGMPFKRIRVHHTGADLDLFRPLPRAETKARLGLSGPVLICVGTLMERKGQGIALRALESLPGATLLLAGAGPERARLERQARAMGLADRVRFLGVLDHEALASWMAAADVAVQPSMSEGLANVWVESLACGTPVVTCDVGGAREAIDRPAAGRIVARGVEPIAAAIADLLASPPSQDKVRASAERFSWSRNAAELLDHLAGVAEQGRRRLAA